MKVTVERKKPGSPAVTLLIREPPSDISVDIILALEMCSKTLGSFRKDGPDIKKWLGKQQEKELNKMKLCLVPKNAKDGVQFKGIANGNNCFKNGSAHISCTQFPRLRDIKFDHSKFMRQSTLNLLEALKTWRPLFFFFFLDK